MKNKVLLGLVLAVVILLVWVSSLANTISRKNGEIELLKEKLATSQSVNEGLKDSVEKLIRYNECTAKILIAPRSQAKAIAGDINDPSTALERCRIEVAGTPVSENPSPTPTSTNTNSPSADTNRSSPNTSGSTGAQTPPAPPQQPPPLASPPPQSILPGDQPPLIVCIIILGICI